MKALPIRSAVPLPPGALLELARQLEARLNELPGEMAEKVLDCTPDRLVAMQKVYLEEREHIRYAQNLLELYGDRRVLGRE